MVGALTASKSTTPASRMEEPFHGVNTGRLPIGSLRIGSRSESRSSLGVSLSDRERSGAQGSSDAVTGKNCRGAARVHGVDANSVLNGRVCKVAKARGFEFCIRYISRQDVQPVRAVRSRGQCHPRCGAGPDARSARCPSRIGHRRKRWGPGTERMRPSMCGKSAFPRVSTSGLISREPRPQHRMRR